MSGDHNQFQKPKSYLDDMNEVRKALEMALEALEGNCTNPVSDPEQAANEDAAITAIKEALAQPEQEPVAWATTLDFDDDDIEIIPAKAKGKLGTSNCDIPLYTAAQKREWVGLTEKEWYAATGIPKNAQLPMPMLKGIEKALKEKNG